jgi:hypothetical protein
MVTALGAVIFLFATLSASEATGAKLASSQRPEQSVLCNGIDLFDWTGWSEHKTNP